MADGGDMRETRSSRPVPDPTLLTTQQLTREIASLKELVYTRLDGVETAMKLFREDMTRVPTEVDRSVGRLKELHETRFTAVDQALRYTEKFAQQQQKASEEAIGKTERAVDESLKQIGLRSETTERSLAGKIDTVKSTLEGNINDIKQRLTTIETSSATQLSTRATAQSTQGHWIAIGMAVLGVGAVFASVILTVTRSPDPQVRERVIERQAGPSTVIDRPNQVVVPEGP